MKAFRLGAPSLFLREDPISSLSTGRFRDPHRTNACNLPVMATQAKDTAFATIDGGTTDDYPGYRTPPNNTEIEAALIGAILTNNRAQEKVSEFLRGEHFYEPVLGRIFEAATETHQIKVRSLVQQR